MKKLVLALCLTVALCGCGKKPTTPQAQQDLSAAQAVVQGCLNKGTLITKSGRAAIENCIAPPNKLPAIEQCAETAALKDKLFTADERTTFEQKDLPLCVENNR